jgi:hypothetical protein
VAHPSNAAKKDTAALSLLATLKAVGPAIGAAAAFEVAARTYFGAKGLFSLMIPIFSATGLLITSAYLFHAKMRTEKNGSRKISRFSHGVRAIGLFGVALFSTLMLVRIWNARPNAIHGKTYEAGFLCDATSGLPVVDGKVVVLSRGGRPMSSNQDLDSRGFFYADLDRWSFLPGTLQIFGKTCKVSDPVDIEPGGRDFCPASRDAGNLPLAIHQWRVKCE